MKMKGLLLCFLFFIMGHGLFVPCEASAAGYPDRLIQLIIPAAAGSQADINGRLLAGEMEKVLGTKIVVMNKPGASNILGISALVRSKKDGYTFAYPSANGLVYARVMNPETISYDTEKDVEPLGIHVFFPNVIAVRADSPWKNFEELVDYAKKNPGKLRVATVGEGTIDSFNIEIIQSLTGARFTKIPFEGGESVTTALLGGHVEVVADVFSKYVAHAKAGKVRILLITKKKADFPEIPTMPELHYKQDLASVWMAAIAPAGIPEDVKRTLVEAVAKAASNPDSKAKIEQMGNVADYESPAELRRLMTEDYDRALAIAKRIGLRKP
ncbi:MAG TPA: tripartite tricarboxylate transporter substrate binding protein [Syntrophorhabdales bacterium]|nr:tripartite tricarboxylate transporter substrate binding protein [Syntrophorhabdales bacterium]